MLGANKSGRSSNLESVYNTFGKPDSPPKPEETPISSIIVEKYQPLSKSLNRKNDGDTTNTAQKLELPKLNNYLR